MLDRDLGREVAVKILTADKRDPTHRVRFRREATRAVAARPEDRFASARELAEALGSSRALTTVGKHDARGMRRRWWPIVAALAMLVAGTGVTIWTLRDCGSRVIATAGDGAATRS